jgi:hypothetical protein
MERQMQSTMKEVSQRARRYWLIDGLAEITLGFMFLLLGLFLLATAMIPKSPVQGVIFALGLPALLIGLSRFFNRLMRSLKTRLTYPRTGYVAYQKPSGGRRWITLGIGAALTVTLIGLMIVMGAELQDWMPLLNGLLLGFLLIVIGQGLKRFYLLSAASVLIGLLLFTNHVGGNLGHGSFYSLIGLLLLASGCLTFVLYLRNQQDAGEKIL